MNLLRRILPLIVLLFFPTFLAAQVSGLSGKHFVLKTDPGDLLLNNNFRLQLEVVTFRAFSFTTGYEFFNTSGKLPNEQDPKYASRISRHNGSLGFRFYTSGQAPKGFFFFCNTKLGSAAVAYPTFSMNGSAENFIQFPDRLITFGTELGYGFQTFFARRFSFETAIVFLAYYTTSSSRLKSEAERVGNTYPLDYRAGILGLYSSLNTLRCTFLDYPNLEKTHFHMGYLQISVGFCF
jgi:hypothetical protein